LEKRAKLLVGRSICLALVIQALFCTILVETVMGTCSAYRTSICTAHAFAWSIGVLWLEYSEVLLEKAGWYIKG